MAHLLEALWIKLKLCVLVGISPAGCALALAAQNPNYSIRTWQTGDGLPQGSVTSITQTPDGYLWLATFNGLARFDGAQFTVFDGGNTSALQSSRLVRLDVDRLGGLWIINEEGGLAQLHQGRFRSWTGEEGWPRVGAAAVVEGPGGHLLLVDRAGGVSRIEGGRMVPDPLSGLFNGKRVSVFSDRQERLWAWSSQNRCLGRIDHGQVAWLEHPERGGTAQVRSFCRGRDGGLWLVLSNQVWHYDCQKEELKPTGRLLPDSVRSLTCMLEDQQGDIWVSSYGQGLLRLGLQGDCQHFSSANNLSHNSVRALWEDREGNLWVGTDGGGLNRLKRKTVTSYGLRDGMSGEIVMGLAQDQRDRNSLWIGLNGGGVNHLGNGKLKEPMFQPAFLTNEFVYGLLQTRQGEFWLGVYASGIVHYAQGRFTSLAKSNEWADKPLLTALEDRSGGVWLGGGFGLLRQHGGELTDFNAQLGWSNVTVRALAENRAGALYVGSSGRGLSRFAAGQWTSYRENAGLADDHITCLYCDRDDVLWIGTSNGGLSRLRQDRFASFTTREGLPSNTVATIIEDEAGYLWLASNRGLFRVQKRQFDELAQGSRRVLTGCTYGLTDGLDTLECGGGAHPAACRTEDGRLWFATVKGLTVVDPAGLPVSSQDVPVVIEEVLADGRPLGVSVLTDQRASAQRSAGTKSKPPVNPVPIAGIYKPDQSASAQTLVVAPGYERLEFRFTGLSFMAPERLRFRYRLEGFDAEWVDGVNQRLASYTHLSPGHYVFRVTACNNNGAWSDAGAALGLLLLPPWWSTWWFRLAGGLMVCGLFFGFYELRLYRLRRQHALQEAFSRQLITSQEDERRRIAGELHDGLGQNLVLIRNRAELGLRQLRPPPQVAEQLKEISAAAAQSLEEVRSTAHALRPYELERVGLKRAIIDAAQKAAETSGVKFACDLEPIDGVFPAETEIALFRIVQEAINNVLRHARASEVIIEIKREPGCLRLTVLDDGCGFDAGAPGSESGGKSGFGLTNIAARAKMIGGELRIESGSGRGTSLTVRVPLKNKVL